MELLNRNRDQQRNDRQIILYHWTLDLKKINKSLTGKRRHAVPLSLPFPSQNVSQRTKSDTITRDGWYLEIFSSKERNKLIFLQRGKRREEGEDRKAEEKVIPWEKVPNLSKDRSYSEVTVNHGCPFKILSHFPTHFSRQTLPGPNLSISMYCLSSPGLVHYWDNEFNLSNGFHCKQSLHSNMPHKMGSDMNKWLLNLDLKLRTSLQIKMTREHCAHRVLTIISWAPNYPSSYYGKSNKSVCSIP